MVTAKDATLVKSSIDEFGAALLETNDLDPVYVVLWEWMQTGINPGAVKRYLLAYWCFYHMGTAAWIVDQPSYWAAMAAAAGSPAYPRGSERRHFRGNAALSNVAWLMDRGVDALFEFFEDWNLHRPSLVQLPVGDVMGYVQTWRGFGPWIAFKVADMLERLGVCDVAFDEGSAFLFDSPKKAAEALVAAELDPVDMDFVLANEGVNGWAVDRVLASASLRGFMAPPRGERKLNVQEAETILCKYGSYVKGHYHVGKDIAEVRHGLLRFAKCRTAQDLLKAGKRGGLWT